MIQNNSPKISSRKTCSVLMEAFLVTCISFLVTFSEAWANPTKAKLNFTYRINGSLAIDVRFDEATSTRCIARHRSSLYHEGDELGDRGVIRLSSLSRTLRKGRRSTSIRATGLQGAVQKNGKDPILAVQVRIVCKGSEAVESNIEARFITCGSTTRRLSLTNYLKRLRSKFAESN